MTSIPDLIASAIDLAEEVNDEPLHILLRSQSSFQLVATRIGQVEIKGRLLGSKFIHTFDSKKQQAIVKINRKVQIARI